MRKLIASTFMSLDGVMQAPGGPLEDPVGGFALGGWSFSYWDEVMGLSTSGFDGKDRELVLGRKTYEIFEAHWPYQPKDDPTAKALNAAKKHVASRTLKTLEWNNTSLLQGDVVSATYAVANALAGKALQAAEYAAYALVYGQGGYGAVADRESFQTEFSWQANCLASLAGHSQGAEIELPSTTS